MPAAAEDFSGLLAGSKDIKDPKDIKGRKGQEL
jgi:hypothetical protein